MLKWFAAMVSYVDSDIVEHFLVHILNPVYRIVEEDTIRDTHMGEWFVAMFMLGFSQTIVR